MIVRIRKRNGNRLCFRARVIPPEWPEPRPDSEGEGVAETSTSAHRTLFFFEPTPPDDGWRGQCLRFRVSRGNYFSGRARAARQPPAWTCLFLGFCFFFEGPGGRRYAAATGRHPGQDGGKLSRPHLI